MSYSLYGMLHLYLDALGPLTAEQAQDRLRHETDIPRELRHPRYHLVVRTLRELVRDGAAEADTSQPVTRYSLRADRRAS